MYKLSLDDINKITVDVEHEGISYSHLKDDLVDHICCEIEGILETGKTFEKAYQTVKQKFAEEGLIKIQNDTLYLINLKYFIMKTLMKISGIAGPILIAFAVLLKIYHMPAAGLLLVIGFFIVSFLFLPTAVVTMYIEQRTRKHILLYILGFTGGFAFMLSVLFKIMHWPGTEILISGGVLILCILFLPWWIITLIKKTEDRSKKRYIIVGAITAFIYVIAFLLKFLHLPGAGVMLMTGIIVLTVGFFPLYTGYMMKNNSKIKMNYVYSIIAISWFVILTALVSLDISTNIGTPYFEHFNTTQSKIEFYEIKCNELISKIENDNLLNDSENILQIVTKANEFCKNADEVKTGLINFGAGKNLNSVYDENGKIVISNFDQWSNPDIAGNYFKRYTGLEELNESHLQFISSIKSGYPEIENKLALNEQYLTERDSSAETQIAISMLSFLEQMKLDTRIAEFMALNKFIN